MGKQKFKRVERDVAPVTRVEDVKDAKVAKNGKSTDVGVKKINIRARKLYEPFMSFLKSYSTFAETLPRRFLEFDENRKDVEALKEENDEENDSEDNPEEYDSDKDGAEDEDTTVVQKKKAFGNTTRAKTIAELKQRLADLRGKKLDYQERLKKKGLKSRLTKKQRLEERAKLRKEKLKQKKVPKSGNLNKPKFEKKAESEVNEPKTPKMIFSKLEIPHEEGFKKKENKDPKRMLQKIEKSQKKLKILEDKGKTQTVARIKEKMAWDSAIKKAEGVKVKDDVELLKKTINKKNELKKHSKKKWDKRLEAIEHRKKESQTKRKENISKKLKEKKQKKIKKSIKKGRVVL